MYIDFNIHYILFCNNITDDILKVVMALSKVDSISEPTRKLAKDTLVRAVKWGLIQSTD